MPGPKIVPFLDPEPSSQWTIRQLELENGSRPVEEFLEEVPEKDHVVVDARVMTLLSSEPFPSLESLKRLQNVGNVWELKVKQLRILGFQHNGGLVLTNGFRKKSNRTPPKEIERATKLRNLFFASLPTTGASNGKMG